MYNMKIKRNIPGISPALTVMHSAQAWELKTINPDRLIVLNKLMDMDKKSQRHPHHSAARASHCVEARGGRKWVKMKAERG